MHFPSPLIAARFLRRRQRFLAEVELADGRREWVHVPNSGALTGCAQPGQDILLTQDGRPGRKTAYTWRFTRGPAGWICIDTLVPNRVVAEALAAGGLPGIGGGGQGPVGPCPYKKLPQSPSPNPLRGEKWRVEPELSAPAQPAPSNRGLGGEFEGRVEELHSPSPPLKVRAEVTLPQGSRLDFLVEVGGRRIYLEVKSVTWVEDRVALFPDGVTARGRRHLEDLAALVGQGHQAWNIFVVQRGDARLFRPAAAVDPAYARRLAWAVQEGVKILVLVEKVAPPEITLASNLPFDLT